MKDTYKQHKVYIPKTRKRILQDMGFDPPSTAFTKADPRGEEYGSIHVRLLPDEVGDSNHLSHESSQVTHSKEGWTAYFRDTPNLTAFLQSINAS